MSACRIGVLGCGAVSELYYAPALQYLEAEGACVVAAVYDIDPKRVATFCEKFPHVAAQTDESFLGKVPLDLVIVASPVSFHEAHVLRALETGHAVLCEKPLAGDTEAGERMIAAAHQHDKMLAVGLLRRFYPNVSFTHQLIQNKTYGAVKSFAFQEGNPFDWPARSDSLFRKATAGGGVLLDIGVHVLDLVVHWFGEPQDMIYADDAMGGLESNCKLELTYPGNVKGTIHLSRDWLTTNQYIIEFERAKLTIRAGHPEHLQVEIDGSPFVLESTVKRPIEGGVLSASTFPQAFLTQLQDMIAAVQTPRAPRVTAEEGIRSLRLIERCYQNRKLLDMPWMTPEEYKTAQIFATGGTV